LPLTTVAEFEIISTVRQHASVAVPADISHKQAGELSKRTLTALSISVFYLPFDRSV
jgi:hypothetical protein